MPVLSTGVVSNRIEPPRLGRRKGQRMPLTSLAPKYSEEHHQLYADLLERAIRHPDSRNVALTGAYGVGKSSALGVLKRRRGLRFWRPVVVELSLSTLDPDRAAELAPTNSAEATRSNRIQKEIVKQLLYRLPTGRTPRSRFPRASKVSRRRAFRFSLGVAAVLVPVAYVVLALTGSMTDLDARLSKLGWTPTWFWGLAAAGVTLLSLVARHMVQGRVEVSGSVTAGAATVTLQPSSSSYFDQYLDEIVYFFQVSKAKVVLIEDVDRFEDALVFDTLRALNGLLNSSDQIGRRIVFVYAVRDSVLEKIGRSPTQHEHKEGGDGGKDAPAESTPPIDPATAALEKASRTKFFDVIIPVVPFVTADNARDLMMRVMAPEETGVSTGLIRLAARHVADMRLIHSIRNEFEVYSDRLMHTGTPAPGIKPDIVLALVLLKVTNPVDYEAIRLKKSSLDSLHTRWRDLVNKNLASETAQLTDLRTQLELGETLDSRTANAGQRLERLRDSMAGWVTSTVSVTLNGPVTDSDTASRDAWQKVASGQPQLFTLQNRYPNRTVQLTFDAAQLAALLGMPIEPAQWVQDDLEDLATRIAETEDRIRFLRHHTWEELIAIERAKQTPPHEKDSHSRTQEETAKAALSPPKASLDQLVNENIPTVLAKELIRHGYLTHHFARYASMFYGQDVSLDAADYIARYVEPGVPEFDYELATEAVGQILREEGAQKDDADLFDDPSVYNVDIVDYLLERRPVAAGRVAARLARWEGLEREFLDVFVARSKHGGALVGLMAPSWEKAVRYATVDAPVAPKVRLELVDAVLGVVPAGERDDLDAEVAGYLTTAYRDLAAVTRPADPERATLVMGVIATSGASLASVVPLTATARAAAVKLDVYPVTVENLTELAPGDSIALDVLRKGPGTGPVYDHAVAHLEDYLIALEKSDTTRWAVEDPSEFTAILTDVAEAHGPDMIGRFVDVTDQVCQVPDLGEVPAEAWFVLVARERTNPTFANVQRYIEDCGVDLALGSLLMDRGEITDGAAADVPDRLKVAVAVLAARKAVPEPRLRVALAMSLEPGQVPATSIEPENNDLVGLLLDAELLADEPSTFIPRLMGSWDAFEPAVAVSDGFAGFAEPSILPAKFLPHLIRSRLVSEKTKARLVARLTVLLPGASVFEAEAIATVMADQGRKLSYEQLSAVRATGVRSGPFMRLLAAQDDDLDLADLKTLLREMGGAYEKVANGGSGTPKFPADNEHRVVLSRLAGDTHTGVKVETSQRLGERLVTRLRNPRA